MRDQQRETLLLQDEEDRPQGREARCQAPDLRVVLQDEGGTGVNKIEHSVEGFGRPKAEDFFAMAEHSRAHHDVEDPWEVHFLGFSDLAVWRNCHQLAKYE